MHKISGLLFRIVCILLLFSESAIADCDKKQNTNEPNNNSWHCFNSSDTVFVFVHGILSNSASAWLNSNGTYWPDLIVKDGRFKSPSVFLGGFHTEINSGSYDMRAAANELFKYMSLEDELGRPPVLNKPNIVFVTHSTGGIVVRHILTQHVDFFKNKKVGVALIASPSIGSRDANRIGLLLKWANNKMGQELKWNNTFLRQLDLNFRVLIDDNKIPALVGVEILETKFIYTTWIFNREEVVTEASGARYFGEPKMIGGANHFTVVKPVNSNDSVHVELLDFYLNKFYESQSPVCQIPSRFRVVFNAYTGTNSPYKKKISEYSSPDRPSLVVIEPTSDKKFSPTTKQVIAKQGDHFKYAPDGYFPCSSKRYTSKFSRFVASGSSQIEYNNLQHETPICFIRSNSKPNSAYAQLNCTEGDQCDVASDAGLAERCKINNSWHFPKLFSSAYANVENTTKWIVPSLTALYQMEEDSVPGFTEFQLYSEPLNHEQKIVSVSYGVKVNDIPLYFDGFPPHTTLHRFHSGAGISYKFGIENLGFTGANDGHEKIDIEVNFYSDNELEQIERISRSYQSYRHTREPNEFKFSNGEKVTWVGKYQPATKIDRFEVMLASSNLSGIKGLKYQLDKLQVSIPKASLIGVIRPSRPDNPATGLALGMKFDSGQVKSTFDFGSALSICKLLLNRDVKNVLPEHLIAEGDAGELRALVEPDMYLYQFDPAKFTNSYDRGVFAGACSDLI